MPQPAPDTASPNGAGAAPILTIIEYNNKGDLSLETPIEPALMVQRIEVGMVSAPLHNDTLLVVLFASAPCEFAFVMDDGQFEGEGPFKVGDVHHYAPFIPIAAQTEVTRFVHLNAKLRIAVR